MPTAKSTWYFTQGSNGWSLSLWKAYAAGQLDRAQGAALDTADSWANITGQQTRLVAVKTTDDTLLGDSILEIVDKPGRDGISSEDVNTTITIKMESQDRTRKKVIFMRGVWDTVITAGGVLDQQNALWNKAFAVLQKTLSQQQYGWMGRDVGTFANITNYVINADGTVTFALDANVFAAGLVNLRRSVRISGLNNRQSILNGQQVIIVKAPNSAQTVKAFGAGPFTGIGRLRFNTKDLQVPAFINTFRVGERKAGAPFLHQRGRLRNRAVR